MRAWVADRDTSLCVHTSSILSRPNGIQFEEMDGAQSGAKGENTVTRYNFFLPVKPLSHLFRRKFLTHLHEAFAAGNLGFHGSLSELAHPARFADWVGSLKNKEWVA